MALERVETDPSTTMSSNFNVFEQIGQPHVGVCSFISNHVSASKQLMWLHSLDLIGTPIRANESCTVIEE